MVYIDKLSESKINDNSELKDIIKECIEDIITEYNIKVMPIEKIPKATEFKKNENTENNNNDGSNNSQEDNKQNDDNSQFQSMLDKEIDNIHNGKGKQFKFV